VYYFSLTLFTATTFTTRLHQLHMNNYYPAYASGQVNHKLQKEQISYASTREKYNETHQRPFENVIFLLSRIFCAAVYGLFFKKRKYS